jgi:hypothetical protein
VFGWIASCCPKRFGPTGRKQFDSGTVKEPIMLLDVGGVKANTVSGQLLDSFNHPSPVPAANTRDFLVTQTGRLDSSLPCAEEPSPDFVEADGNHVAPQTTARAVNAPNFVHDVLLGPVLATVLPEGLL